MEIRFTGIVERYERIEGKPAIQVKDDKSNFIVHCVFTDSSAVFGLGASQEGLSPCQLRDLIQTGSKVEVRATLTSSLLRNLFADIITLFDNNWVNKKYYYGYNINIELA